MALEVGSMLVFSYFCDIYLSRLNIAELLINTENLIIEVSKYQMVISTIVTRVSDV